MQVPVGPEPAGPHTCVLLRARFMALRVTVVTRTMAASGTAISRDMRPGGTGRGEGCEWLVCAELDARIANAGG